ncbi:MAG: helix-turn-helix transcriptional regulator [Alphaproteobacteria bacterium]
MRHRRPLPLGKPRDPGDAPIRGHDFKRWRKSLDLSQKEAANALGLKRRVVQYYEKGERDGKEIDIPKSVRLACLAIVQGEEDYHGPDVPSSTKGKGKHKGKSKGKAENHDAKKAKRRVKADAAKPVKRRSAARSTAGGKAEKDRPAKEKRRSIRSASREGAE